MKLRERATEGLLPLLVYVLPLASAPGRLAHPAPWLGVLASVLVLWTQPPLPPQRMVRDRADKLSAFWIYIGQLVPQLVAIFHYGYRRDWTPAPLSIHIAAGAACVALGFWLRIAAIRTLGRFFTSVVVLQDDQRLVTSGPYRLLRHPSYTGAMVVGLGVTLALGSWPAVALMFALALPCYLYRIRVEEAVLIGGFGDEYLQYRRRTWRLVPYLF